MLLSALSPLLLALAVTPGPTRASRMEGQVLIPASSDEVAGDIGWRMHTNHRVLLGPATGLGEGGGVDPAQLRTFYDMPASGGQGVIAVVDAWDYPSAMADFNVFSAQYGLPTQSGASQTSSANTVFQVVYATGTVPQNSRAPADDPAASWNQEAALDIQWAHALAPGAKIVLVEAASDADSDLFFAVQQAAGLAGVQEVSMSWASSEFAGETGFDSNFDGAGRPLFFGAAGDTGGVVQYPACSQYVVAVGGTSVITNAGGAWVSESAWADGGGGTSRYVPEPSWQDGLSLISGGRGVPDIASDADPDTSGVSVYDSVVYEKESGWLVFGGTSVSAPCMAAMANLSGITYPSTTQFLMTLYSNAFATPYPFRDITTGSNGFPALVGWDFATGVGTPSGPGSFAPILTAAITTPAAATVTVASGVPVSFVGTATNRSTGATLAYAWNFGDGGTATGASASHTFTQVGTDLVLLTVTDSLGATATASVTVTVALAAISLPAGSVGLLTGTSAVLTATLTGTTSGQVTWSSSPGSTITPGSPSTSATFFAAAAGSYTVTATDAADGIQATTTVQVHAANFLDATVSGLDVLDLAGNYGTSDPAVALTGGALVDAQDLGLILQQLGW